LPAPRHPARGTAGPEPLSVGKMRLIFNPHSGNFRRNARLLALLRNFLTTTGLDADLQLTNGPGHATALAREAVRHGCSRVIAIGGDGTVNEVAQGLRHAGTALAIVPTGSGNGLARHLRLPSDPAAALRLATAPQARIVALDSGSVNGRPFFNAMGFGLDAEISRRFNRLKRRGLPAYVRTALAAFLSRTSEPCIISDHHRREAIEILLLAVANSDQYGNGAVIAPGARMDDGQLDLVAVRPVGLLAASLLGARLFLGSFDRGAPVRRLRGARFRIERAVAGAIHTDGEVHAAAAVLDVMVHPRSLQVVVP
jgi:YegS/Rv2252/BmrU family lipid kinase